MNTGEAERLHYLDTLRAFIMSVGVLVHASFIGEFWFDIAVVEVSNMVRMPMFAVVSGYFATLLFLRRGPGGFYGERAVRFGVPTLVVLLLVNPVANYFLFALHDPSITVERFLSYGPAWTKSGFAYPPGTPMWISWHDHLWFLITVLIYCFAIRLFLALARSPLAARLAATLEDETHDARNNLIAMVVTGLAVLAMRILHFATFQRLGGEGPFNFVVMMTLLEAPFFLIGVTMFVRPGVFRFMHRIHPRNVLLALVVVTTLQLLRDPATLAYGRLVGDSLFHFSNGVGAFLACTLLLHVFQRFGNRPSRTSRFLSDAAYTVYLFHILFTVIIEFHLKERGWSMQAIYFTTVPVVYLLCLLLHRTVVSATPLTLFLFNGKQMRPAARTKLATS